MNDGFTPNCDVHHRDLQRPLRVVCARSTGDDRRGGIRPERSSKFSVANYASRRKLPSRRSGTATAHARPAHRHGALCRTYVDIAARRRITSSSGSLASGRLIGHGPESVDEAIVRLGRAVGRRLARDRRQHAQKSDDGGDVLLVKIGEVVPRHPLPVKEAATCTSCSSPASRRTVTKFQHRSRRDPKVDAANCQIGLDVRLPFGVAVREDLSCVPLAPDRCRVSYRCDFGFPTGLGALSCNFSCVDSSTPDLRTRCPACDEPRNDSTLREQSLRRKSDSGGFSSRFSHAAGRPLSEGSKPNQVEGVAEGEIVARMRHTLHPPVRREVYTKFDRRISSTSEWLKGMAFTPKAGQGDDRCRRQAATADLRFKVKRGRPPTLRRAPPEMPICRQRRQIR